MDCLLFRLTQRHRADAGGQYRRDMSNIRACSCVRLSKKRAAPARPSTTVSAFEARLRPLGSAPSIRDHAAECLVQTSTGMEGGYLLFRMPKRVISVRQKSAHLILHSRVVTEATRLRHSAFQRRLRNSRTPCDDAHEPATALSPGAVPSGDSAQPLWEAEFLLERVLLPHVPSSIWSVR